MLDPDRISHAVDMQQRSYELLKWVADAIAKGFISFDTAHKYSTLPEATREWIEIHYLNIPPRARVDRSALPAFCNFFATYLENSFDLIRDPKKQLYSDDAHCFCPLCSRLVNASNLATKKVTAADKRRAQKLKESMLRTVAAEQGIVVDDAVVAEIVADKELREDLALVTYAHDLLKRLEGIATGPAVLSLWRQFAWDRKGAPKKKFQLTADLILSAEEKLLTVLRERSG